MPEVRIERLALKLSGTDRAAGVRLAEQLAAALTRVPVAGDLPERAETVRVKVQAAPGAGAERLAEQVMAELLRQLRRS